jgi:hypothetical protein
MTEAEVFLTNCRLADGRLGVIGIAGGKIAVVCECLAFGRISGRNASAEAPGV